MTHTLTVHDVRQWKLSYWYKILDNVIDVILNYKTSEIICSCLCIAYGSQNCNGSVSWWRHQMKTFSALLAFCAGNWPVTSEFPSQRPLTRSFVVFFGLCLDKRLSKQSKRRWFETPSRSLCRHCNRVFLYSIANVYPWPMYSLTMSNEELWISNYITRYLCDVIACPCPRYLGPVSI